MYETSPRHLIFCLLFHILPLRLLSGVVGRYEKWGILASHILLSQKLDLKEMQVIHFDQDVQVCEIFRKVLILNIFGTPLNHESLYFWMNAFYLKVWAIFIFFVFFSSCSLACIFFSHAFWHGHFSFLSFFSIAHTILFGI